MSFPSFSPGEVLNASDMNAVGLWRVTTVSPTAATTIAVNNCFTSDYTNYTIIVTPISLASASDITLRLRVGGTPDTSGNYFLANIFVENTSIQSLGENATTNWRAMNIGAAGITGRNSLKFDLYGPAVATPTRYQMNSGGWSGSQIRYRSAVGFHDLSTAYDGFDLTASSNITATISVYGYNKS
ncbi:hypothetical protein UFOVP335_9 [uncultured Caudovirales phage]|uniref:Uncharacterized protein n=1 Tax=uncultured Caudovirales phage TaxID=2100421 RepID=A0A6J5LZK3_9CAUD|nr:hypothetical protein UFOVP335_9 [uncultured Caudovirales phage]